MGEEFFPSPAWNDDEPRSCRDSPTPLFLCRPQLKLIVVEDGLASNAPHTADLKRLKMRYLLGAKPSDHKHLFDEAIKACDEEKEQTVTVTDPRDPQTVVSETQSICDLPLNASNEDVRVNFLQHHEYDPKTGDVSKRFSWITDCELDRSKLLHFQRGGRSRWRIENETFNTLKNQRYHYEHNYGHGKKNLSTVLMLLMFLAFLVDQVQQASCPLFDAVLKKLGSRRSLWDHLRSHVRHFEFSSFADLWRANAAFLFYLTSNGLLAFQIGLTLNPLMTTASPGTAGLNLVATARKSRAESPESTEFLRFRQERSYPTRTLT